MHGALVARFIEVGLIHEDQGLYRDQHLHNMKGSVGIGGQLGCEHTLHPDTCNLTVGNALQVTGEVMVQ